MFDLKSLLATAAETLAGFEKMVPLVKLIPGEPILDTVLKGAQTISEVVDNTQARLADANVAIHSDDQATIQAINARLSALDDELMDYVDKS